MHVLEENLSHSVLLKTACMNMLELYYQIVTVRQGLSKVSMCHFSLFSPRLMV